MAKVIVAIIIVPFALFGIESLLGGGGVQYAAEVNGQGISAVELQQQINQQKRRLLGAMGDQIDPAMLDDQMLAGPALEFMIQKELMMQAATDYGLAVSDERLGEFIAEMPVFQIGGRFDPVMYRQVVSDQGYSPAGFQDALREDLVMTQLRAGLASSEFATSAEVDQLAIIRDEQRDVRYLILPLDTFRTEASPGDDDIQAWYEENQDRYVTEESVTLEYIELTLDQFRQPIEEERLREVFEVERDAFQLDEQRRVSHILFEQGDDETEEQLQVRIDEASARLAAGDSFDDVAAAASDDIGSASFGGDLGYTSGDAFPPAMETAIANLEQGEVSEPVETDAGWHLITVTEILAGETAEFETVRVEIEARLQDEEARVELVKTVENLRDLVFNADDLAGPAAELELTVSESESVTRSQAEGLFAERRLNSAAFSTEVLNDRYNSEVIELTPEQFVVLRVTQHKLPETRPLEEVRAEVESALAEELARSNIRERARDMLAALEQGSSIEEQALAGDFEWQVELAARRDNRSLPATLLRRLFQLPEPAAEASTFDFVQNSDGDIELFELVRVTAGSADNVSDSLRQRLNRELSENKGRQSDNAYQQALRENADVVRSS